MEVTPLRLNPFSPGYGGNNNELAANMQSIFSPQNNTQLERRSTTSTSFGTVK